MSAGGAASPPAVYKGGNQGARRQTSFAEAHGRQGLALVHYSAQLEPFMTQKHTLNTLNTPCHPVNTPETIPNCTPCHTEGA
jgi:hypothetical protein